MTEFDLLSGLSCQQEYGLYRYRKTLASAQRPEVWVDGKKYIAFCSNNYLGLADHPDIISSFQKASADYGVGGGASNLVIGHSEPHHQLEKELAAFTGRERALLFSNGYMANIGVITALLRKKDAIFLDRLSHASLLDAGVLSGARFQRYQHRCCQHLERHLKKSEAKRKLIVTDSVFSMDGDIAPLHQLLEVAERYKAWLMVDDSHGFGVLGKTGGGVAESHVLPQHKLPILMSSLGKAFGTYGAFVAGSHELIETLIQFSRTYIYTTSIPPAVAEASRVGLLLMQKELWRRDHLNKLINYFRQGCKALDFNVINSETPIQPLLIGSAKSATAISDALMIRGILVTAIRPPTVPEGTSRLRISLSAAHTHKHVDLLLDALNKTIGQNKKEGVLV